MLEKTPDQIAFEQVSACRPQWSAMRRVNEFFSPEQRILLHAGPPFPSLQVIPAPVMNSLCIGAIYEGWASDYEHAQQQILAGDIQIAPAQDHQMVVPLAGVISPSMALMEVRDANQPERCRYAVLNEGMVHCTRLGKRDPELNAHLHWLNGELAEWIDTHLPEPIDLYPVINAALAQGDDCHGRTIVSSQLLVKELLSVANESVPSRIATFLNESLAFALNVWMAACSLAMSAAEGVAGSTLVSRAGGNGYDFGLQLASRPGQWITMAAPPVRGPIEPAHRDRCALGAIGDSAVVDFFGLGGQVLSSATASYEALRDHLPEDALQRPEKALTAQLPALKDRWVMTSARQVAENQAGPMVLLGMIESTGEAGRIGGGVADVPPVFFNSAMAEVLS